MLVGVEGMIIHSFSGPSGTGKSTSALQFAFEHQIEAIIDDGLLIINGEKKAGISAKFEKNTIKAVRRAIFQENDHKQAVLDALNEHQVQSILIIGTSDKMTKKIAQRLELGPITYFHYVEDVRSKKEIQMAKFVRGTQGKHVMPIPYKQVEQNFFKRLVQKGFEISTKNREKKIGETTIVRPDFQRQTIHISKKVYIDIIKHAIENYQGIAKIDSVQFGMKQFFPVVHVIIYFKSPVTYDVVGKVRGLQAELTEQFLKHFEFEPGEINIEVKGII